MSGQGVSNAVVEGCSGALGSVIAMLATYPLKTIYTLQALSTGESSAPEAADSGNKLLSVLRFMQQYKLSTLYAGLPPNIVEAALSSGVYFFFYSKLREMAVAWTRSSKADGSGAESRSKDIGMLASLLVPLVAGALNQLTTMPASVVATRMQGYSSLPGASKGQRPPGTLETIAAVFRESGLGGFWKGLLPSMILLANPSVQYMLYEKIITMMRFWKEQRVAAAAAAAAAAAPAGGEDSKKPAPKVTLSAFEVFAAGALAKIGATIVTYPLIVIKARMQASSKAAPGSSSTWGTIVDTARYEGVGGFYKGLRAKILQTALNAALMLMLKEQLHGATKTALTCAFSTPVVAVKAPSAAG
ncbi:hypothetical protein Agub_g12213 [Astrephomene gubernaculifera]|uniref:Uncharacterized protein n=1 Tax=Astrephomene gubernaculifera TaxID=47775 RepID=A0AAD3E2C0_9CHLO|nr:hypothetical protein Agub_g12213 [Astrephomene gubernaculifera]